MTRDRQRMCTPEEAQSLLILRHGREIKELKARLDAYDRGFARAMEGMKNIADIFKKEAENADKPEKA